MITFAIPMAPKSRCTYWVQAMKNFKVTINSILRQSRDDYEIVVAATAVEDIPRFCYDDKINILTVDDSGEFGSDKDNKTLAMLEIHRSLGNKYFLRTDWDDVFHKDLVKYVVANENSNGFMITKGYFYKPYFQNVIELDNFNMHCGSCHLVNYSDEELSNGVFHPNKFKFHHQHIHEYRQMIGRPLTNIPFRAGLYTITGNNISTPKHNRILKGVAWQKMTSELRRSFNV